MSDVYNIVNTCLNGTLSAVVAAALAWLRVKFKNLYSKTDKKLEKVEANLKKEIGQISKIPD